MRLALTIALLLMPDAAAQAERLRYRPMPSMSWEAYERLTENLMRHPPLLTRQRLPVGYKLGRCLLEVDRRQLISGTCAYTIMKGGDFEFHGPHQVYAGIDYPKPEVFPAEISTDYFVQIDHELVQNGSVGSGWKAHWNEDKRATHAQAYLGPVARQGACYVNSRTKICLWKQ